MNSGNQSFTKEPWDFLMQVLLQKGNNVCMVVFVSAI